MSTNVQTWECGAENASDVIATLEGTTLTIRGKGKMKDYDRGEDNPSLFDNENITHVHISEGVENIGNYTFLNCYGVQEASISKSVTQIGEGAFFNCAALRFFNYVHSDTILTRIEKFAFYGSGLVSFSIPESVTFIGRGAFLMCDKLKTIYNERHTPQTTEERVRGYVDRRIVYENASPFDDSNPNRLSPNGEYNITLLVQHSAVFAYKNAPMWKNFMKIESELKDSIKFYSKLGAKYIENIQEIINKNPKLVHVIRDYIVEVNKDLIDKLNFSVKEQSLGEDFPEQLDEKLREIDDKIEELQKKRKEIFIKKLCMRGLKGNPQDVAQFMALFNQRAGLKFLTHDFDETGAFDRKEFLSKVRNLIVENEKLKIPKTMMDLLNQFAFEKTPNWIGFDKNYEPKEIKSGWSALDWEESDANGLHPIKHPEFAEVIRDFKRAIRIESPNLETLVKKAFSEESFEITKKDLSKADFYTHAGNFYTALQTIFEEIQQRSDTPDKKKVSVEYKKAGANDDFQMRDIVITHHNSYPTRDDEDLIKDWLALEKGNMGKIAGLLQGYFHWSVITKINDKPVKVNILREKGTPEQEDIDDVSKVEGFTHILTFYNYQQ